MSQVSPRAPEPGQTYRLPVSRAAAIARAPVALFVVEGPEHRFRFVSDAFRALIGDRELDGRPAVEALPELVEAGIIAQFDLVRVSGAGVSDAGFPIRPDALGEPARVDFACEPLPGLDGSVAGVVVAVFDNTVAQRAEAELRSSEERLRESERQLRATQEIAQLGSWRWEVATNALYWSPMLCALFGLTPENAPRDLETYLALVHPEDRAIAQQSVERCLIDGAPFQIDHRIVRRDGRERVLHGRGELVRDADGTPLRLVGSSLDVTEMKQVEAALRVSELRSRFLARASQELAASLDLRRTLDAVARLAVPALADWCFVEMFEGDSRSASALKPVVVHHADPELVAMALDTMARYPLRDENPAGSVAVVRTGQPVLVEEVPDTLLESVAHDDAHLRIYRERARFRSMLLVPLRAGGEVIGVLSLATSGHDARRLGTADLALVEDLATRVSGALDNARLYAAERTARASADEANRAKSEFLATMSHELRTPLNAIAGYVDLLEMEIRGPVTEEQRLDLGRIRRSQQALLALVNDVLNFARLDSGRVEYRITAVPLDEALAELETLVAPQLRARALTYEYAPPPAALRVRADADKLRQIALNLLSNAVKFTDAGGRVRLAAEAVDGRALVRVSDTGRGIPADQLEAVFEPFVRVETALTRTTEGTGLGLAISRDLARAMGGDLTVDSVEGKGSTFTVVLPIA